MAPQKVFLRFVPSNPDLLTPIFFHYITIRIALVEQHIITKALSIT